MRLRHKLFGIVAYGVLAAVSVQPAKAEGSCSIVSIGPGGVTSCLRQDDFSPAVVTPMNKEGLGKKENGVNMIGEPDRPNPQCETGGTCNHG